MLRSTGDKDIVMDIVINTLIEILTWIHRFALNTFISPLLYSYRHVHTLHVHTSTNTPIHQFFFEYVLTQLIITYIHSKTNKKARTNSTHIAFAYQERVKRTSLNMQNVFAMGNKSATFRLWTRRR